MHTVHEKSSCCRARVCRFGGRRRQCVSCRRTWRAWKKRRGRKRKRSTTVLVERYLDHRLAPPHARARGHTASARELERSLVRSRDLFLRIKPWPSVPPGPLILIADALVLRIRRQWHTMYCMLVRPVAGSRATIMPPLILPGVETHAGWQQALATLHPILPRIQAIVCDGHRGLTAWAKDHRLIIQRCHFHLIAAIQHRRNRFARSANRPEGERVHALVINALTQRGDIRSTMQRVDDEAFTTRSWLLRKILRGFTTSYEDFRSYLHHPKLHLPTTSNTAESFIGCIRELRHRTRGFASLNAFSRWIEALVKHKKTIRCNGFHQPNK